MKKMICVILTILLMMSFSVTAIAAEFGVDPYSKMDGMSKSWYQGYEPAIKNHTMTLYLPIRATNCTGEITVSIALDDPNVFLLTSQPKAVTVSPKNGVYPVKLSLALERNRRNGDYPATITVKGTNEAGEEIIETIPYIIRIRDCVTVRHWQTKRSLMVLQELRLSCSMPPRTNTIIPLKMCRLQPMPSMQN